LAKNFSIRPRHQPLPDHRRAIRKGPFARPGSPWALIAVSCTSAYLARNVKRRTIVVPCAAAPKATNPPSRSAADRTIARPRPLSSEPSAVPSRTNRSNAPSRCSDGMPGPSSATTTQMAPVETSNRTQTAPPDRRDPARARAVYGSNHRVAQPALHLLHLERRLLFRHVADPRGSRRALRGIADGNRASIADGQPAHLLSPLVPSTYLLVSLVGIDLADHQRFTLVPATLVCLVITLVGMIALAFPFVA